MDAHIHLPFTVVVRPACVCQPQQDMEVVLAGDEVASHTSATVLAKDMLNAEILRLSLRLQEKLDFRAGQFAHLLRGDGLSRSFSLATAPTADGVVDFHIRRLPGGAMSGWIHNTLGVGETIDVAGPYGSCFYTPGMADQGLLRIGTGSGLAPLHRIALDALRQGHSGPIRLYHGSWRPEGLYLVNELRQCSADHGNFQYHPCADDKGGQHCRQGRADQLAIADLPNLKGWRVYLCGHPDMVKFAKKQAFLAGASIQDIYSDPFVLSSRPCCASSQCNAISGDALLTAAS